MHIKRDTQTMTRQKNLSARFKAVGKEGSGAVASLVKKGKEFFQKVSRFTGEESDGQTFKIPDLILMPAMETLQLLQAKVEEVRRLDVTDTDAIAKFDFNVTEIFWGQEVKNVFCDEATAMVKQPLGKVFVEGLAKTLHTKVVEDTKVVEHFKSRRPPIDAKTTAKTVCDKLQKNARCKGGRMEIASKIDGSKDRRMKFNNDLVFRQSPKILGGDFVAPFTDLSL